MSTNAFYDAYGATQNALGDPRGDAEKRREQDIIMQQRRQQMQASGYDLQQKQLEDHRAAQARQMQEARAKSRFGFVGGSMYPNAQPAQQAAPMAGNPNAAPMQGQQYNAQNAPDEQIIVTAQGRGPMPNGEEELDYLIRDAYQRNDVEGFNSLIDQRRSAMSDQEKAGRQKLAVAANQIFQLQTHEERVDAVKQVMRNLGVSPDDTTIDDYFNNPEALVRELNLVSALGDPGESVKQMTEQQYAPITMRDLGNRDIAVSGTGQEVRSFNRGIDPGDIYKERQANIRNRDDNITSAENSKRSANSDANKPPSGYVLNAPPNGVR
jgi:hypothetical protein